MLKNKKLTKILELGKFSLYVTSLPTLFRNFVIVLPIQGWFKEGLLWNF